MKICRFCLEIIKSPDHIAFTENSDENGVILATKQMLFKLLPDLTLYIVEKPLICSTCYVALCDGYLCGKTEEFFKRLELNTKKVSRFISNNPGLSLRHSDFLNLTTSNGQTDNSGNNISVMFAEPEDGPNKNENIQWLHAVEDGGTDEDIVCISDEETNVDSCVTSLNEPIENNGEPSNNADKSGTCKSTSDSGKGSDLLITEVYSLAEEVGNLNQVKAGPNEDVDGINGPLTDPFNENNSCKSIFDSNKPSDMLMVKVYSPAGEKKGLDGAIQEVLQSTRKSKTVGAECCLCEEIFENAQDLLTHLCTHSDTNILPTPGSRADLFLKKRCDICEGIYFNNGHLIDHKLAVHGIRPSYVCPLCQGVFKFRKALFAHTIQLHTRLNWKLYNARFFCDI